MKRISIIAPLGVALTLALAGCPSGYGQGNSGRPMPAPSYSSIFGNSGNSGSTPEAGASTYVSIFDTPTAPVAKADAAGAPGLYECHDTMIPSPTGLRVNVAMKPPMIQGQVDIRCDVPPRAHITTMIIHKAAAGSTRPAPGSGLWRTVSTIVHGNIPGPVTTSFNIYTSCLPGWYFLSYTVSGITGDQVPRTFGPLTPTGPQVMIGQAYYVSGDDCP